MSKVTITINTDNASFEEEPEFELARILARLAADIKTGAIDEDGGAISDSNGNTVGRIEIESDEDEDEDEEPYLSRVTRL